MSELNSITKRNPLRQVLILDVSEPELLVSILWQFENDVHPGGPGYPQ